MRMATTGCGAALTVELVCTIYVFEVARARWTQKQQNRGGGPGRRRRTLCRISPNARSWRTGAASLDAWLVDLIMTSNLRLARAIQCLFSGP